MGCIVAEKKRKANSDAIDAMPESLNVSVSFDLNNLKLFVAPASRI